jgi:two-component system response regulator BaeR
MQTILVVEDEIKIANLLADYLKNAGFGVTVLNHGDRVLSLVQSNPPDLLLLDVMLPGKDGMEICREIRKFSNIPIIMITARVEEIDRIVGLEIGADDYICKPFSPREVVARVKALLRRVYTETEGKQPNGKKIVFESIVLDKETHIVSVNDKALNLTPSEFGLLQIMMEHPNRVYSRNEMINRVLGYSFDGYDRTIDTHIKNLRKKISDVLPDQEIIHTVYGIGYKISKNQQ